MPRSTRVSPASPDRVLFDTSLAEDDSTAKNNLESYTYYLRDTLSKLETALNETISWLGASQEASAEEYNKKQRELASIAISHAEVVISGRR